jgi:hypothetical protein
VNVLGCGDWVFVHPDEGSAPPRIRGLAGTISRITGDRASVAFRVGGTTIALEVELAILRRERRRRDRPPAYWPKELAQTG